MQKPATTLATLAASRLLTFIFVPSCLRSLLRDRCLPSRFVACSHLGTGARAAQHLGTRWRALWSRLSVSCGCPTSGMVPPQSTTSAPPALDGCQPTRSCHDAAMDDAEFDRALIAVAFQLAAD